MGESAGAVEAIEPDTVEEEAAVEAPETPVEASEDVVEGDSPSFEFDGAKFGSAEEAFAASQKSYMDLKAEFTRRNQEADTPAPVDPLQNRMSATLPEPTVEALRNWMSEDPRDVAIYAIQNPDKVGGQKNVDDIVNYWAQTDPVGFNREMMAAQAWQLREEMAREYEPVYEQIRDQTVDSARAQLMAEYPSIDEEQYDRLATAINDDIPLWEALLADKDTANPGVIKDAMATFYQIQLGRQQGQTAVQADVKPKKSAGGGKPSAGAPDSEGDTGFKFFDAIGGR